MKFIVAESDYRGESPKMYAIEADSIKEMLLKLDVCYDPENEDSEYRNMTEEEVRQMWVEINGDGQPYYMAWCIDTNKQVLG